MIEKLPKSLFRVELDNGHRLLAFTRRREQERWSVLRCGDRVTVEMTPFDFSTGRLCESAAASHAPA